VKTWAIVRREYRERVRSKAFVISTLLIPAMMVLMFLIPLLTEQKVKPRRTVAVLDAGGALYPALQRAAAARADAKLELTAVPLAGRPLAEAEQELRRLVSERAADGGVVLPPDFETSLRARVYTRSLAGSIAVTRVQRLVRDVLRDRRYAAAGIPDSLRAFLDPQPEWEELSVTESGEAKRQDSEQAYFVAVVMIMLLYFSMLMYGQQTLTGVIEEKASRVAEIVLSSVPASRLMLGKVAGIGAAGLTQIAIWVLAFIGLSGSGVAMGGASLPLTSVTPLVLVSFAVFFLLGYLMYATLYAGVGALCNTPQEAQPFAGPLAMFLVIPMLLLTTVTKAPDGTLATVLSLVPLFSPMLMFMRICIQTPPLWQIALSWVLVALTVLLLTRASGKLFRVGILMHGAAPSWKTVVRVLRQPD